MVRVTGFTCVVHRALFCIVFEESYVGPDPGAGLNFLTVKRKMIASALRIRRRVLRGMIVGLNRGCASPKNQALALPRNLGNIAG